MGRGLIGGGEWGRGDGGRVDEGGGLVGGGGWGEDRCGVGK